MSGKKNSCYNCAYRSQVTGSAHSQCNFDWNKTHEPMPNGQDHGIKNGWFFFPFNYDPVWMIDECPVHSTEKDPNFVDVEGGAMKALISLLAKRI